MQTAPTGRTRRRLLPLPDVAGLGGAIAGFLAGLVMIGISPLLSLLTGISIWEPPRLIAATLLGPEVATESGFAFTPVLTGTLLHMAVSVGLGLIFGIVFRRVFHMTTEFGTPMLFGLCYGLLIFLVGYAFLLPAINPLVRDSYLMPLIVQNMVFGVCLGMFYLWLRPQPYSQGNTRS